MSSIINKLGAQGSASIGHSGGVRNTGKGTGTAWSREPCIPPCVGTVSELPNLAVAGRPRLWCQGLYHSTPLLKNLRVCTVFPSSLVSAGSPRDRTLNSVRWKSKGQNPEFWPAGPALLLALCRPAGPGAPARMGKGRVRELHPGGRRGSKEEGRAPYCPLMADRICGCPAAWAFSWGPCAIKVYR